MGHVKYEVGSNLVGNLTHALEIPQPGIGACATNDDLRLFLDRSCLELVVIDGLCVPANVIESGAIELTAKAELMSVRQVPAVRQVEAKDGVARLKDCRVCRCVRLRARVGLHVDVVATKNLLGAIAGQILHDVSILTPAVVAAARI